MNFLEYNLKTIDHNIMNILSQGQYYNILLFYSAGISLDDTGWWGVLGMFSILFVSKLKLNQLT